MLSDQDVAHLAHLASRRGVFPQIWKVADGYTIAWTNGDETVGYFSFYIDGTTAVWTEIRMLPSWEGKGIFSALTATFPLWFKSKGITRFAVGTPVSPLLEWMFRRSGYTDDPTGEYELVADPDDVQKFNVWQASGQHTPMPGFVRDAGVAPEVARPDDGLDAIPDPRTTAPRRPAR